MRFYYIYPILFLWLLSCKNDNLSCPTELDFTINGELFPSTCDYLGIPEQTESSLVQLIQEGNQVSFKLNDPSKFTAGLVLMVGGQNIVLTKDAYTIAFDKTGFQKVELTHGKQHIAKWLNIKTISNSSPVRDNIAENNYDETLNSTSAIELNNTSSLDQYNAIADQNPNNNDYPTGEIETSNPLGHTYVLEDGQWFKVYNNGRREKSSGPPNSINTQRENSQPSAINFNQNTNVAPPNNDLVKEKIENTLNSEDSKQAVDDNLDKPLRQRGKYLQKTPSCYFSFNSKVNEISSSQFHGGKFSLDITPVEDLMLTSFAVFCNKGGSCSVQIKQGSEVVYTENNATLIAQHSEIGIQNNVRLEKNKRYTLNLIPNESGIKFAKTKSCISQIPNSQMKIGSNRNVVFYDLKYRY